MVRRGLYRSGSGRGNLDSCEIGNELLCYENCSVFVD
jgi:hypothetical protein